MTMTKGLRQDRVLGGGGFGSVYRGCICDSMDKGLLKPQEVAVKVYDGRNSYQGHGEWLAEVLFLGQLSHPNLVKLIGYCCEDAHRVLVYEFMARGCLENNLFSRFSVPLSWCIRMKIALGAARGLAFLHEAANPVIYRDFKTSNILLDMVTLFFCFCCFYAHSNAICYSMVYSKMICFLVMFKLKQDYNVKLSDFGLAKDGPDGDNSHVSTRVMGTYGYTAPEYIMTGHLSMWSDVYSYGVVLLELITGRKSLDKSRPGREKYLTEWALPLLKEKKRVVDVIDPRLGGDYPVRSVYRAALLAYHCLSHNPKARPLMRDVVASLEPLQVIEEMSWETTVFTVITGEPAAVI